MCHQVMLTVTVQQIVVFARLPALCMSPCDIVVIIIIIIIIIIHFLL